jgi:hypothetical protein
MGHRVHFLSSLADASSKTIIKFTYYPKVETYSPSLNSISPMHHFPTPLANMSLWNSLNFATFRDEHLVVLEQTYENEGILNPISDRHFVDIADAILCEIFANFSATPDGIDFRVGKASG